MLKFTEEENVNDMHSEIVTGKMYCSTQINALFVLFKLHRRHREPAKSLIDTKREIIRKWTCWKNCHERVLQNHITFGIRNDEQSKTLLRTSDIELEKKYVDVWQNVYYIGRNNDRYQSITNSTVKFF